MTVKAVTSPEGRANDGEHDAEVAVELVGFGRFNIKVVILCGLIYLNTAFSISSVGLVLPSAACDFNLTTIDQSRIASAPMLGMFLGAYFWGCLADIEGRRFALLGALFSHGLFELISSVTPNYWGYVALKFLSGVSINGQSTVLFTYLGEFQSSQMREKILCWMELAWSLGLIALPLVGWLIIPFSINFDTTYFFFHSWNLFVAVCSLPSFLIGLWLLWFPETPKYLASVGKDVELKQALEIMYLQNTKKPFSEYTDKVMKCGNESLVERLRCVGSECTSGTRQPPRKRSARTILQDIINQTLLLLHPDYLRSSVIVCSIMFCLCSSYYTLVLWFPELFRRFSAFSEKYPTESASVCKVSQSISQDETAPCDARALTNEVYIHTLILGVACVPLSMILPLFVNRLGYKFYLIVSTLVATSVIIGLFFVRTSTQNLILSCIFEAFSSVGMSIVLCIVVDLYPTSSRVMAAAMCGIFARLGALIGNILFGYLINNQCVSLIIVIAGQLLVCAGLGFLIPSSKNKKQEAKVEAQNLDTHI